jgi:hypothetical protein
VTSYVGLFFEPTSKPQKPNATSVYFSNFNQFAAKFIEAGWLENCAN